MPTQATPPAPPRVRSDGARQDAERSCTGPACDGTENARSQFLSSVPPIRTPAPLAGGRASRLNRESLLNVEAIAAAEDVSLTHAPKWSRPAPIPRDL